ncbi:hypothetical protein ACFVVX_05060 [Kitasatospora sp. NPDC058170]|uniref:hypothetical protein n=1 Tax=Kitasatospora sp. NPDC058170 TaxID=3346364 RepID=UPI0036DC8FB3
MAAVSGPGLAEPGRRGPDPPGDHPECSTRRLGASSYRAAEPGRIAATPAGKLDGVFANAGVGITAQDLAVDGGLVNALPA